MEESLRHAQGVVLVVVRRHAYLAYQLLLGGGQLRGGQAAVAQALQLLVHQVEAEVHVGGVAAEVDAERARVGVGRQVRLHVVDQPAAFAQRDVQAAVHARPAQQVVQQIEGRAAVVVGVVAAGAQHDVRLVRTLIQHEAVGHVERRGHTAVRNGVARPAAGQVAYQLLGQAHHTAEIHVAQDEEHHIFRPVVAAGEGGGILRAERAQPFGPSQDVAPQRMAAEDEVLEIVEYQFGRIVLVRLYLVDDDLGLLLNFALGKGRVEHDVGQQLEGAGEMLHQEGRIDHRLLLVGIGVQVAAHVLHAVQDVPRPALLRSLEDEVLHKVGHALLLFAFVARAGIDSKSTISHPRAQGLVDDAQAVGQRMHVILRFPGFKLLHRSVFLHFAPAKIQQNLLRFMENCGYLHPAKAGRRAPAASPRA